MFEKIIIILCLFGLAFIFIYGFIYLEILEPYLREKRRNQNRSR